MAKYGRKTQQKMARVLHEFKEGELKSHGKPVRNRQQAIAIGLDEARRDHDKVPPKQE